MTYHEKSLGLRRSFELNDENIVITGNRTLSSSFRHEIALKSVKPGFDLVRTWGHDFRRIACVLPWFLALALLIAFGDTLYRMSLFGWSGALGGVFVAMMLTLVTAGKTEFMVFKSHGEAALFTISANGNEKAVFDAYVNELKQRIQKAQALK